MIHLTLPNECWHPLPFYLAMEEVAARHFQEECFFTWVVPPTVIFGRNQVMQNEVNLSFCQEHGVQLVRRKSGGGCVYADEGNIMLSYITPTDSGVEGTFTRYLQWVVNALGQIGVNAEATGRNDILVDGRKLSGNAFYMTDNKRHSIVHGTLLHSTDLERMLHAITPSTVKLEAKGVESVRQRVINLSEKTDISLPDLRKHMEESLCDQQFCLTPGMMDEVDEVMQTYLNPSWIMGKHDAAVEQRVEGVGTMAVHAVWKDRRLQDIAFIGDYFCIGDIEQEIMQLLRGKTHDEVSQLAFHPERAIMGLTKEKFLKLLNRQ